MISKQGRLLPAIIALLAHAATGGAQSGPGTEATAARLPHEEVALLAKLIDATIAGQPAGGDAWLHWENHFLRGTGGNTYVAFTITINEAPGAFEAVGVYVRVLRASPDGDGPRIDDFSGSLPGAVPVSVPERQFGPRGAPTAGEASAILSSVESSLRIPARHPFQTAYAIVPSRERPGGAGRFRGAVAVPPGEYEVYVALRERSGKTSAAAPRWASLKKRLLVPDLSTPGLGMSSVIVADRVETLDHAPAPGNEAPPYVFGSTRIVPATDDRFTQDETLTVVFFVYGARPGTGGKPDVSIEYCLYDNTTASDRRLGCTPLQALNDTTLPEGFDFRAGHQLVPMQFLPLHAHPPGEYRLGIRVVDDLAGRDASTSLRFTIGR